MTGIYGRRIFDHGAQQIAGISAAPAATAVLSLTDMNAWQQSSVTNVNESGLVKISDDKYAIIYNTSGVNRSTSFTVDANGRVDTISRAAALTGTTSAGFKSVCRLADDKIFVATESDLFVVTYSGLTPTAGTEDSLTGDKICIALSATEVLIIKADGDFHVAAISGTTITLGSAFNVSGYVTDTTVSRSAGHAYDSTHVVLVGGDDGTVTTGFAIHFTIDSGVPSGTQDSKITLGTGGATPGWADIAVLNSANYVGFTKTMARAFSRSSTTLTALDSEYTAAAVSEYPAASGITSTKAGFLDTSGDPDSGLNTCKTIDVDAGVISASDDFTFMTGGMHFNNLDFTANGHLVGNARGGGSTNSFQHQIYVIKP